MPIWLPVDRRWALLLVVVIGSAGVCITLWRHDIHRIGRCRYLRRGAIGGAHNTVRRGRPACARTRRGECTPLRRSQRLRGAVTIIRLWLRDWCCRWSGNRRNRCLLNGVRRWAPRRAGARRVVGLFFGFFFLLWCGYPPVFRMHTFGEEGKQHRVTLFGGVSAHLAGEKVKLLFGLILTFIAGDNVVILDFSAVMTPD